MDQYFGREYGTGTPGEWPEGPMEIITRTYETMFRFSTAGNVVKLAKRDPELLEFALGLLFRFDPE